MQKGTTGSGQPDAPDFFHSSATQALVDGVMLAIDRGRGLPCRRASLVMSSPAATRHSLFARPTLLPARTASYVASRPATPTIALTTKSTSGCVAIWIFPAAP